MVRAHASLQERLSAASLDASLVGDALAAERLRAQGAQKRLEARLDSLEVDLREDLAQRHTRLQQLVARQLNSMNQAMTVRQACGAPEARCGEAPAAVPSSPSEEKVLGVGGEVCSTSWGSPGHPNDHGGAEAPPPSPSPGGLSKGLLSPERRLRLFEAQCLSSPSSPSVQTPPAAFAAHTGSQPPLDGSLRQSRSPRPPPQPSPPPAGWPPGPRPGQAHCPHEPRAGSPPPLPLGSASSSDLRTCGLLDWGRDLASLAEKPPSAPWRSRSAGGGVSIAALEATG